MVLLLLLPVLLPATSTLVIALVVYNSAAMALLQIAPSSPLATSSLPALLSVISPILLAVIPLAVVTMK